MVIDTFLELSQGMDTWAESYRCMIVTPAWEWINSSQQWTKSKHHSMNHLSCKHHYMIKQNESWIFHLLLIKILWKWLRSVTRPKDLYCGKEIYWEMYSFIFISLNLNGHHFDVLPWFCSLRWCGWPQYNPQSRMISVRLFPSSLAACKISHLARKYQQWIIKNPIKSHKSICKVDGFLLMQC